ncbi:MAG: hypothetical protein TR69_WS6001001322 [candidate division WS6 bacterium OLB20]|uniref:Uncharacterized protein n=1 Tax=candidate division WS6 bacterium OLB20 TaxID=1617426 RepID=A0A136LWK8_9BACT|nr:MAG: hypothetical protein TR69_WS6001001322 [candidate division WS6 bacterium OLB20]
MASATPNGSSDSGLIKILVIGCLVSVFGILCCAVCSVSSLVIFSGSPQPVYNSPVDVYEPGVNDPDSRYVPPVTRRPAGAGNEAPQPGDGSGSGQQPGGTDSDTQLSVEFDITDLSLSSDTVLQFKLYTDNDRKLAESNQFVFNPNTVAVSSDGTATLSWYHGPVTYSEADEPLYVVLYEVIPDSTGNPGLYELSKQTL